MLTAAQHSEFEDVGFVRFEAFSSAAAAAMQDAIWDELARVHHVQREDRASWPAGAAYGLQHIRERPTFSPIGDSAAQAAIDELLGAGGWDAPTGRAGEIVLTQPWLLHCQAPDCGAAPRFMRTTDIYRRELHPSVYRAGAGHPYPGAPDTAK